MLARRIATAAVLIALISAALFLLPPRAFGAALLIVVVIAANEWASLARFVGANAIAFVALIGIVGLALLFGLPRDDEMLRNRVVLTICGVATLFWIFVAPPWVVLRWPTRSRVALALVGLIVLIGAWLALVELKTYSPWLVLAAMAIVWIADTAAFFGGRAFGRRKLAPEVSPGKTWEGVCFAITAVALYALLLAPLAGDAGFRGAVGMTSIATWIAFAAALAAVSIVGDLFESLLKRHAGVKDSGRLLPGHGGVLDRTDALLAAMPPAAVAAVLFLQKH